MKEEKTESSKKRIKEIPDYKIKTVSELVKKIKDSNTILIASTKGLPSSQFHEIKKSLRGKAEIRVAKKNLVIRALDNVIREGVRDLEKYILSDVAIFFSSLDAFELSALLSENQSPAKAKAGEIAPEDITIEPGPTSLVPGPAISELSSVGLKVAVEGGKLAIKQGATVAHKGEEIKENVASVLAKLDILPMKVGFEPIAAYDTKDKKVYSGIKIDKKKTLEELKTA
ncbi:50S ribosomal protein L10, partial [Candidatus Pacearchaeota archaeon]|nr:50S ribosomal protein L10 [Candidatus Pacearchaeota archaeon]